ncbi:MAG: hypothetical protein EVA52_02560 [Gammaproteobacteria bacterium]|nr:MAG: hypothetical protein EVA52_02560 [Gammaproteobacteria bacterium]
MPKLYNAKKLGKGLKIGLRELNGAEWFADMTLDADKRTCRKINVPFLPEDERNTLLAENKAKKLFEELLLERFNETNQKINVPSWQIKFFSLSLILLWITGMLWLTLDFMDLNSFGQTQVLILHGALIIPALVSLGVLIVSHIPEGWEPTKRRKSGYLLSFIMLFLVISGFVLFYEDSFMNELSYSHSLTGLFLVPLIFWHFKKKSTS